jgi:hypothetical protein
LFVVLGRPKVNVDQAVPKPNFKDIFSAHLGKLHLAEATPLAPAVGTTSSNGVNVRGAGSAPSPRRKDSGQRQPTAPNSAAAAAAPSRHQPRNYEFAEVEANGDTLGGGGGGRKPAAPAFNQSDEYDFQFTSSAPTASRPATGQQPSVSGATKYDEVEDDDYFDEYDDDSERQPPVPSFSGLFGSSSSAAAPSSRSPAPAQASRTARAPKPQPPREQAAAPESGGGQAPTTPTPQPLDTGKKGVLCVPNMPQTPSKKHQYNHHQPRRTLSLGQRTFKERGPRVHVEKPEIVIDAPNVAMVCTLSREAHVPQSRLTVAFLVCVVFACVQRHANNKKVSVRGIHLAIQYWEKKGHQVIAFIPEHYLNRKAPPPDKEQTLGEFMPLADDLKLLAQLVDDGTVVLCPPQDYDDSYCIEYSKRCAMAITTDSDCHQSCVLTRSHPN